ncbi:MFS transporter [Fontivita pretiosa]|uniref:MFS transporter n=1 Tax=Fontivita pretiosa TaxID=2989684 RepID=UPI003D16FD4B
MQRTTRTQRLKWLNSTVLGIGLASLCSDVGHEMATAAMPALLATMGASSAALGLIEGLADGLSSFAKLLSGAYSDRLQRRKPLAVLGYFVTASGMASFALATQWWHVLMGRVVGWIGRGARSPVRNVLLTEATTPQSYGRAFGLERAMDSAGAVIGPLVSLVLLTTLGMRWTFAITLIPGAIAAILIALLVRERPHVPHPHPRLFGGMAMLPRPFRRYLVGVGIAGIGDFSNTLLILWTTQAWTPRMGTARAASLAMAFYVAFNVIYTLCCYGAGAFADRFPKNRVLAFGYVVATIPAAALMLPGDSYLKFALVFGFSGLYMGIWETLEHSMAAELLPAHVRGSGFGMLATVNGLGDFMSSILVGSLWVFNPSLAMSFVVVVSLVGAWIVFRTPHVVHTATDAGSA